MKRLLVCLLLVGVVGCGESEQVQDTEQDGANQQIEPVEDQLNEELEDGRYALEQIAENEKEPPPARVQNNPNLTACPDCGSRVSYIAVTCPECGRPLHFEQEAVAALEKLGAKIDRGEDGKVISVSDRDR